MTTKVSTRMGTCRPRVQRKYLRNQAPREAFAVWLSPLTSKPLPEPFDQVRFQRVLVAMQIGGVKA